MNLLKEIVEFFLSLIKGIIGGRKRVYYTIKNYFLKPVDAIAKIEDKNKIVLRFWSDYFPIKFLNANITTTDKDVMLFAEKSEFGAHDISLKHPLLDCIGIKKYSCDNSRTSYYGDFCVIQVEIYYKILFRKRCFKQSLLADEKDWR